MALTMKCARCGMYYVHADLVQGARGHLCPAEVQPKHDKFTVTKEIQFCYGHRIPNHTSKCRNVHGHQARVEVTVEGPLVPCAAGSGRSDEGMVVDFTAIKQALVVEVEQKFDHRFLLSVTDQDLYQLLLPKLDMESRGSTRFGATYYVAGFGWVQEVPAPPTAEFLAMWVYLAMVAVLNKGSVRVTSVRFWETPTSVAEYKV